MKDCVCNNFLYRSLVNFVGHVGRMSRNDEKLPCLHYHTKRKFLGSDTNMGCCLYIPLTQADLTLVLII